MLDVSTLTLLPRVADARLDDIGRVLHDAIAELGTMLDVDYVGLLVPQQDRLDPSICCAWSAPGAPTFPRSRLDEALPELVTRSLNGGGVEVALGDELQRNASFPKLRDLRLLPLRIGGALEGVLAMVGTSRSHPRFSDLERELRTLGHVIAMALHRHHQGRHELASHTRAVEQPHETTLTERQREVLRLIWHGQSSKQIAQVLDISPRTVAFHRARIKESLGASTTVELLRRVAENELIER